MDYVLVERSALDRLVDVHVPRGAVEEMFDHFSVESEVKMG